MVPKTGFGNFHDWITTAIGLYAVNQCVGWGKGGRSVFLSSWYHRTTQTQVLGVGNYDIMAGV